MENFCISQDCIQQRASYTIPIALAAFKSGQSVFPSQTASSPVQNFSVHISEKENDVPTERLNIFKEKMNIFELKDEYNVFGRHVAFKMCGLAEEQRILAQKLINDVIFVAEMQDLTRECRIVNCGSQRKICRPGSYGLTLPFNSAAHAVYSDCDESHSVIQFIRNF